MCARVRGLFRYFVKWEESYRCYVKQKLLHIMPCRMNTACRREPVENRSRGTESFVVHAAGHAAASVRADPQLISPFRPFLPN